MGLGIDCDLLLKRLNLRRGLGIWDGKDGDRRD